MQPESDVPQELVDEPSNEELRAISRRSALRLLGGAGLFMSPPAPPKPWPPQRREPRAPRRLREPRPARPPRRFGAAGSCVLIPEETEGPYALDLSGDEPMFRSEITEGHPGVPLSMTLALVDANADCVPVSGARVDLWHCDADGSYSGFSQPGNDTTGETFCRGIQLTDDNGQVTFQTVYPGWYQGRITHVHFQVFLDSGLAATSQIAFPEEVDRSRLRRRSIRRQGPQHIGVQLLPGHGLRRRHPVPDGIAHRRPHFRLHRHPVGGYRGLTYSSFPPLGEGGGAFPRCEAVSSSWEFASPRPTASRWVPPPAGGRRVCGLRFLLRRTERISQRVPHPAAGTDSMAAVCRSVCRLLRVRLPSSVW